MTARAFEVTVKGGMGAVLCAEFEDIDVVVDHSITTLRIVGGDQSALYGILGRIESLGLELLDVHPVDDEALP